MSFNSSMAKPVVVIQFKMEDACMWPRQKSGGSFGLCIFQVVFDKMLFQCNICGKMWRMLFREENGNFSQAQVMVLCD